MQVDTVLLSHSTTGTARSLTVYRFGDTSKRPQLYIQSSLHADEIPGMLVAVHLCDRLEALEREGKVRGHVVVVPCANPIGLSQSIQGAPFGRFALADGTNFNRHFADLTKGAAARVLGRLGTDIDSNTALVRDALKQELASTQSTTELAALKRALLELAFDAEYVLDLHCDGESVSHVYTATSLASQCAPLAALLGAEALLTAEVSGDNPFDEAISRPWADLARMFPEFPIAHGSFSATIELRGEADVSDALAAKDAQAIIDFATLHGIISGMRPQIPTAKCVATPLAGVLPIVAPSAGVVVFAKAPGERVAIGEAVARIVNPLTRESISLNSEVAGVVYARIGSRYAIAGQRIAKVAGANVVRSGKLLSP
jgi:uncharacterized protein